MKYCLITEWKWFQRKHNPNYLCWSTKVILHLMKRRVVAATNLVEQTGPWWRPPPFDLRGLGLGAQSVGSSSRRRPNVASRDSASRTSWSSSSTGEPGETEAVWINWSNKPHVNVQIWMTVLGIWLWGKISAAWTGLKKKQKLKRSFQNVSILWNRNCKTFFYRPFSPKNPKLLQP